MTDQPQPDQMPAAQIPADQMPAGQTLPAAASAAVTLQDQREALALLGTGDANLRRMRELTRAKLVARGETVTITGTEAEVQQAERMVRDALDVVRGGGELTPESLLRSARMSGEGRSLAAETQMTGLSLPRGLKPKTPGQKLYLEQIAGSDITFGVGPAGTGKTYMAVAMAIQALKTKAVKRIILTRPAVEAGEKAGLLARRPAGQDRSLPAPAVRRPAGHAGPGQVRGLPDQRGDRDRAAGLYARADAERRLYHPGRGAEHHRRADEDVPDPHGLYQQGGDHRATSPRSTCRATSPAGWRWPSAC